MKKYMYIFLGMSVLVFCGGCSITNAFAGDKTQTYDNMDDLVSYVESHIEKGESEISFSTEKLDIPEIQEINTSLDGYYGSVSMCKEQDQVLSDSKKITLDCEISDNYYVEKYFLEDSSIPEERTQATDIARVCEDILHEMSEDLEEDATDYEKELWIHDYIVLHTSYGYPEGEDAESSTAHESYGALVSHKAVCNGYAFAMKLLCDITDIPCTIITGSSDGESHAWNLVKLDDHWYHVDVTWDDPSPDQEGRIIYTYLNINDERASLGHQWQTDRYPAADADTYNYYIRNDLYCEDYEVFKEKCITILQEDSVDDFQLMVADYDGSIYSDENMEFMFKYTDAASVVYQSLGEIPYKTLYISLD